jgi:hypothetical protein
VDKTAPHHLPKISLRTQDTQNSRFLSQNLSKARVEIARFSIALRIPFFQPRCSLADSPLEKLLLGKLSWFN